MRTLLLIPLLLAGHAGAAWQHFEARQVHPLAMTPDGSRLIAADSPSARVTVFDLSGASPSRVAQIPVGLEPVTVRARTNDEVWVVNEAGDTVSIISLSTSSVVETLRTGDEPTDVLFVGGQAWVACARANQIRVYDAASRAPVATIPLNGIYPHALALSPDGSRVYAAFLLSGNRTTVLPRQKAPPQPVPTNPALPEAPDTAQIVAADHPDVPNIILDHDVAEVDSATRSVLRYISDVGTNLFDLACRPGSNELWVANTNSLNLVRFEPALRGHFADSRLSVVTPSDVTVHDLNPGIDYNTLPNEPARAIALAQPASLVFSADGSSAWTAAFASDRIAKVDPATGGVLQRIDIRTGADTSASAMRGPRGLVLDEVRGRLYTLNKISSSVSVINTTGFNIEAEVPLSSHNPIPDLIRKGRGQLFDARLSGNGTNSCGICHIDADRDGLAWDLGDPGGSMITVYGANLSVHDTTPRPYDMHPMKGPMATQTLRGMQKGAPFHWRGDKPTLQSFNGTFHNLMGGSELAKDDIDNMADYLMSVVHHANPNRNLDRSLPATLGTGVPEEGRDLFNSHAKSHCITCHIHPDGSNHNIDLPQEAGLSQPVKNPPLRTLYQRQFYDGRNGAESLSGFGLLHDGTGYVMPIVHPYVLDLLETPQEFADLTAFLNCFDTGTAPTVGYGPTVTTTNRSQPSVTSELALLESRTVPDSVGFYDCDLVARGFIGGEPRSYLWKAGAYRSDRATEPPLSRSALLSSLSSGDWLSFMGVLPGAGSRLGGDEDEDGFLDKDDPNPGQVDGKAIIRRQPVGATVVPGAAVQLKVVADGMGLSYQWKRGTTNVGANSPVLDLASVSTTDGGSYKVIISNGAGSVTSSTATLNVLPVPEIKKHPASVTVKQGTRVTLSVTATGTGLKYQWRKGTSDLSGETRSTLVLTTLDSAQAGSYSVRVYNDAAGSNSQDATVSILPWPVMDDLLLPDAIVGQDYSAQVSASNGPAQYFATNLPAGLKINPATGAITGRPTTAKSYFVRIKAANAAGTGYDKVKEVQVDPFPADSLGVFQGIVPRHASASLNRNLGGLLAVTTTKLGAFSGTLTLGTARHGFKGELSVLPNADPTGEVTITRKDLPDIDITFTLLRASRRLTGEIKSDGVTLSLDARLPTSSPAAYANGYTFAMKLGAGDIGDDNKPQGHSFGAIKVTSKGAVSGVVRLADNSTPVTLSGTLGQGGRLPVFALLYSRTGSLLGTLEIIGGGAGCLNTSALSWHKPRQTGATRSYKDGFDPLSLDPLNPAPLSLVTLGGVYVIPGKDDIAMGLTPGAGNARLTFREGRAPSPTTRLDWNPFEVLKGSPAKLDPPDTNPGQVKLTLTPGSGTTFTPGVTGAFKGGFKLVDSDTSISPAKDLPRSATFLGMIVDDGGGPAGYGFFNLAEMPADSPKTTPTTTRILSGRVELSDTNP
ncbi:MAG: hypothetical protein CJBNEKGG_02399 [Prosthecobacter sp.]|nr:hypothetical protein [Prosthecobacter sp.]